ncbi:hypothetical protein BDV96DRAFT_644229 [Lophiotrema nucula]|uniref:MARVEL domain-containing protein n=1 Tax=Lophiotrema nucula TaxID=690887 RepID=A0A6A5ZHQ8_9PLEO|nr:hypothetical protein BDV96DRAFT_644229 [Lophiotrema nucula]
MASAGYSVVPVQKAFTPIRIIQLVLALIVLGLSAYPVSLTNSYASSYVFTPGAIAIFTAIATKILVVYWFVANSVSHQTLYNYWAVFAVELFVWVFWLTTFALYASWITGTISLGGTTSSTNVNTYTYCYAGYCVKNKRGLSKRDYVDPLAATIYAALAFSVINFVLFSLTAILYTINLVRHRNSEVQNDQVGVTHVVELHTKGSAPTVSHAQQYHGHVV